MTPNSRIRLTFVAGLGTLSLLSCAFGQAAPGGEASPAPSEVIKLSPFVVLSETETGYQAKETLANMRIKTDLKDVGAAIDVLTEAFLDDVGVTNMFEALQYVANMEINAYPSDNDATNQTQYFSSSYKSRGINGSTVLLDFFSTGAVPIDRYNSDNLTLLRGANAILFGIGSPSGIVGSSTKRPLLSRNSYTLRFTTDAYGSMRTEFDVSQALLRNRLAVRLMAVIQDKHLYQKPSLNRRNAATLSVTYKPFSRTAITVIGEAGIWERLHEQNSIVWDAYTPWVLAGKPLATAKAGAPGAYSTAAGSGMQNISTGLLLTYIEGSNLPVMDWRNMARGARWSNAMPAAPAGVFNSGQILSTDRSQLDSVTLTPANTIVKLNGNPWGGTNTNDLKYNRQSVFIEQNLARELDVELAWNRFESDYLFQVFGMNNFLSVDPNVFLPNGAPNPYVGMPYIETGTTGNSTRKTGTFRVNEDKRVTLSYRLNLDKLKPLPRVPFLKNFGLGDYRMAALYADAVFDSTLFASRPVNVLPLPGGPTTIPLNQQVYRLNRRYYLKPGESSYNFDGTWTFDQPTLPGSPAANAGPVRIEERNSDEAPRNTRQSTVSHVAALQGSWLPAADGHHYLTAMYGIRRDTRESNVQSFTRQANGEYSVPINTYDGIEEAGVWGQETSFSADTKSLNVTARPFGFLRIFYNFSDIFSGGAGNFVDVFGRELRPSLGETKDYGVKLEFWEGRIFLTAAKYETSIVDQTNDNTGNVRAPINDIYNTIQRSELVLDRPFSYRNDTTTGYEFGLTAAVTQNLRARATVGTQKTYVSANMNEIVDYFAVMKPIWEAGLGGQGRNTLLLNPSAGYTTVGNAIDRAEQRLRDERAIIGTRPRGQRGINSSLNVNYSFPEGRLKGLRIGGGYRWASANVIGYARDAAGNSNINRPYRGPEQVNTDLSLGYSCKILRNRYTWDIQLNVYNVMDDDDPKPRGAVDDGRGNPIYIRYYLPDPRGFQVTNTVRF